MRLLYWLFIISLCYGIVYYWIVCTYKSDINRPFTIVCTTSMLADATRNIVGPDAQVIQLMGPGIDPHLYRAREGDIHHIAQADMVLYHGLHLEGRLATLFEHMSLYIPTYAVSNAIPISALRAVDARQLLYDPHVWHAISLWCYVVNAIAQYCADHDPVHADNYRQRTQSYVQQLETLHEWIIQSIKLIPPQARILVTAHDAFGYFGDLYGLEVVALQGIST